jgi:hypothetical protein
VTLAKTLRNIGSAEITSGDVRRTLEDTLGVTVTNVLFSEWLGNGRDSSTMLSPNQLRKLKYELRRVFGEVGDTLFELILFDKGC